MSNNNQGERAGDMTSKERKRGRKVGRLASEDEVNEGGVC